MAPKGSSNPGLRPAAIRSPDPAVAGARSAPGSLSRWLSQPRRADLAAIIGLLLIVMLVLGDVLISGGTAILSDASGDILVQFIGWRRYGFGELAHGHLPLWNPFVFGGAPYLGGFQSALLYPPNVVYLLLPIGAAINLDIALHLFLSGTFMHLWMRRRGLGVPASAVSGLVFMLGGAHFLHVFGGHLTNLCTMAWAPAIFMAIDEIITASSARQRWRGAWIGAGAVAMQCLAGHPQYVFFTAIVAAVYACLGLIHASRRGAALLALGALAIGGACIASGQILAGLQATTDCLRGRLSYDIASSFPLPPESFLTAIMPTFLGNYVTIPYWGRWSFTEDSLFVGVGALAVGIYGALKGDRRLRRFSLVMMIVTLVLAMGSYTPLYWVLYHCVPGFQSFRGVSKFSYLTLLFFSVLVGSGMDRLLHQTARSNRPARLLGIAAILLLGLSAAVWVSTSAGAGGRWVKFLESIAFGDTQHPWTPPPDPTAMFMLCGFNAAKALLWCGITCVAVSGCWYASARRPIAIVGVVLIMVIELGLFAHANHGTIDLDSTLASVAPIADRFAELGPEHRVMGGAPIGVMGLGGYDAWGNDPMILKTYADAMAFGAHTTADQLAATPSFNGPAPIWRLFRVSHFLGWNGSGGQFIPINWRSLRRAQLISKPQMIPDSATMLAKLNDPSFNPAETVMLSRIAPSPVGTGAMNTTSPASVTLNDHSPDEIEITAQTPRPAILLISDNYSTGWEVRSLDSAPAQSSYTIVPADYTLRAIPLSAGSHHLMMEYRPSGWIIGRWFSLAGVGIYLVWGIVVWRGKGSPSPHTRPAAQA